MAEKDIDKVLTKIARQLANLRGTPRNSATSGNVSTQVEISAQKDN
jgi:hypothetical protein